MQAGTASGDQIISSLLLCDVPSAPNSCLDPSSRDSFHTIILACFSRLLLPQLSFTLQFLFQDLVPSLTASPLILYPLLSFSHFIFFSPALRKPTSCLPALSPVCPSSPASISLTATFYHHLCFFSSFALCNFPFFWVLSLSLAPMPLLSQPVGERCSRAEH